MRARAPSAASVPARKIEPHQNTPISIPDASNPTSPPKMALSLHRPTALPAARGDAPRSRWPVCQETSAAPRPPKAPGGDQLPSTARPRRKEGRRRGPSSRRASTTSGRNDHPAPRTAARRPPGRRRTRQRSTATRIGPPSDDDQCLESHAEARHPCEHDDDGRPHGEEHQTASLGRWAMSHGRARPLGHLGPPRNCVIEAGKCFPRMAAALQTR